MAGYIGKQAVVLSTTAADVNGNADIDGNVTATGDFITDEGKVKAERVEVENDTGPNMYATAYGTGSTTYTWFEGTGDNKLISWGNNGDISFYDDDGSTVGLRWDASSNNLGIGTTSPSEGIHLSRSNATALIESTDGTQATLDLKNTEGHFILGSDGGSLFVYDQSDSSERMRIDTSGNVGIGTTSPSEKLHVTGGNIKTDASTRRVGYWETDAVHDGYLVPYNASGQTELVNSFGSGGLVFKSGTSKSERMRIDTSGNVGIGISSPAAPLVVSNSGAEGLEFIPDSSANAALVQAYNRSTSAFIPIQLRGSQLEFNTGGTQRLRIDSDGLKFNGDTAADNALNDYEEGTWTPGVALGTASAGGASYVKIGATVWVTGSLSSFSNRTGTSTIKITGLPFNPVNSRAAAGNLMGRYVAYQAHCPYMTDNGVTFYTLESGNWRNLRHTDLSASSNAHIYFSLVYQTTA